MCSTVDIDGDKLACPFEYIIISDFLDISINSWRLPEFSEYFPKEEHDSLACSLLIDDNERVKPKIFHICQIPSFPAQ